ncbi:MAG: transketolase [Solirubrobacterales bacterium]
MGDEATAETDVRSWDEVDALCVNTIRTLSIDAIQKANSGHPGTPMALAPVAYALWQRFLRFDPSDPIWPNRDRFVLSAGHASMLLYALLHLADVQAVDPDYETAGRASVTLDDIESFRQLDSRAAGHPEYRWTSGVEATTGPLGQGIATTVGMAVASKWMGARYNRPDATLFDFDVYAIAGDGCLMEGVSNEAASFAGHQQLDNLCWIYDNNHITIDGRTDIAYGDDVAARFMGYGWNVDRVGDANDLNLVTYALERFRSHRGRPTLIIVDSHIGFGSPHKQDTAAAHGEPLGEEEVRETKRAYGWPEDAQFLVPDGVKERFAEGVGAHGKAAREQWEQMLSGAEDEISTEIDEMQRRELPEGWEEDIPSFDAGDGPMATRKASNQVQNAVGEKIPWLLAGSADLTDSTSVRLKFDGATDFQPHQRHGRQLHYGVREHESAAISNGLALSKLRPAWSTYLVFSDYARPAIRLSALMELPVIHIFTHDSIGLGEDGPTHQPVEHLASLRAIPGLDLIRPCDANEVAEAWKVALDRSHQPVALVLTRQDVPILDRGKYAPAEGLRRGGYVLADPDDGKPELILISTGSEVALAIEAHEALAADGVRSRVVSLPSWSLFDRQDEEYRESVLPKAITARVSIEEASTLGWDRYVGTTGRMIGMHTFGSSAPLKEIQSEFGFTPEKVVETAREVLAAAEGSSK